MIFIVSGYWFQVPRVKLLTMRSTSGRFFELRYEASLKNHQIDGLVSVLVLQRILRAYEMEL